MTSPIGAAAQLPTVSFHVQVVCIQRIFFVNDNHQCSLSVRFRLREISGQVIFTSCHNEAIQLLLLCLLAVAVSSSSSCPA